MRIAVTVMVLVLVAIDVEPADACQCVSVPSIVPLDSATNLPTNPMFVRRLYGYNDGYELQTATGEIIDDLDTTELAPGYIAIRPHVPLAPNTAYEIVTLFDGGRTAFTTGADRDDTSPLPATLRSIRPEIMAYPISGFSSCVVRSAVEDGHISRLVGDHELPSDAVFAVLELRRLRDGQVVRAPFTGYLGFDLCQPQSPILEPDADYCARIVSYDAAGNESSSDEVCNSTTRCEPLESDGSSGTCEPSRECRPVGRGCNAGGNPGWLVVLVLAISRGSSRRSARRRHLRAPPPAP